MFFRRLISLFVLFSFLLSSIQIHAAELSGQYAYLPQPVIQTSSIDTISSQTNRTFLMRDFNYEFRSPLDLELDRMEAIQSKLKENNPISAQSSSQRYISNPVTNNVDSLAQTLPTKVNLQISTINNVLPNKVAHEPKISNIKTEVNTIEVNKTTKELKPSVDINKKQDQKNVGVIENNKLPSEISLEEIVNSNPSKPTLRMLHNSSIVIICKNIQRYLSMDDGFLNIEKLDRNKIKLTALKYGGTFLNVWDDTGRRTIYVGITFPESRTSINKEAENQIEKHVAPFKFTYTNDYSTFYHASKGEQPKKQGYGFLQTYAIEGQAPFGYLDTSTSVDHANGKTDITTYTLGLSQIPFEGVSDFNLRGFDAARTLSPLTMTDTSLRGVFVDAKFLENNLGLSYSNGIKRSYFSFLTQSNSLFLDSYINAFKLTLFPNDYDNQISLNAAGSYGTGREENLPKKVYSLQARKRIYDLYLNSEYGQARDRYAFLGGALWKHGLFNSAVNFRRVNKDYSKISGIPSNQGEVGTLWTLSYGGDVSVETSLDIYRQNLNFNENNPDGTNLDFSGRLRIPLANKFFSDTSLYYVHTPQDIAPRRNITLDERISRAINLLGFKNSNVYIGGALQKTRYEFSNNSEYDRYSMLLGIQIPLTKRLSFYANRTYSRIHELDSGNDLAPSIFDTGIYYNREITDKLSMNFDMSYHKENGAEGTTSYLAGEDSAGASFGLSYNPLNDINIYFDTRYRQVWPLIENSLPYNDFNVRVGLRMSFGLPHTNWDPYGAVSGFVYKDNNGDGIYDTTDQGVAGAVVKIGNAQTKTDAKGYYRMNVSAQSVLVAPQGESLPPGIVYSTPVSKTVDIKQWGNSKVNFGFNTQTGIYGIVFVDKNGNGIPDASDEFIRNIKVTLDKKFTSSSDEQGGYYFRNITEGDHTISIELKSLPIYMIPQVKIKNKIKVIDGTTYLFHIPLKIKDEKKVTSKK